MLNSICDICTLWAVPEKKGPWEVPAAPPEGCPVGWASMCPPSPTAWGGRGWGQGQGWPQALPQHGWDHCLQPGWVAFAPQGPWHPWGCCPQGAQHNLLCEPHLTSTPSLKSYISVKFSTFVCFLSLFSHVSVESTSQVDLPPPHLFAMFLSLRSLSFRINRCYLVSPHMEAIPYFVTFSYLLSKTYHSPLFYSERSGRQRIISGMDAPRVWAAA